MPTFGYTGSVQTYDVSDLNRVRLTLYGAGGEDGEDGSEDSGGLGGEGGRIEVIADVSGENTLDVFTAGGDGNMWGRYDGGAGGVGEGDDETVAGDGGNGAGQSAVVGNSGALFATADGGGGGGGSGGGFSTGDSGGGGGGGAAGGVGGDSPNSDGSDHPGEDAEGSGEGGDGGDGSGGDGNGGAGQDGGYNRDSGLTTLVDAATGGGNTGNASVQVEPLPTEPDNVQQDVEDDDTVTVTGDEGANSGPVDNYEIEIKTDGGSWTLVASPSGGGSFSHTETIARATDTVQFRVRAVNSAGASDWVYTTTQSTNATGLGIDAVDVTSIDLSWTDPDANDGTDVLLAESTGSTAADYSVDQSVGATAASATIDALEHGERYYARVQATYSGADGTPAPVGNEVDTVTDLPAPTIDGLDASTLREITITYSLADNSTDGDVLLKASTDGGATWSAVATITDLSATSYTHTGLLDGEVYTYRLTRRTDHASTQSGTASVQTELPAMTDAQVEHVGAGSAVVTAQDNANHKDGYRVYTGPDGYLKFDGNGYATAGDIANPTTGLTVIIEFTDGGDDGGRHRLIDRSDGGALSEGYRMEVDWSGNTEWSVGIGDGSGGYFSRNFDFNPYIGEIVVGALVWDGSTMENYLDDMTTALESISVPGIEYTNANQFALGAASGGSAPHNGSIRRVGVFARALTQSEREKFKSGGMPSDPLWWSEFNDGSGSTVSDYSGNGNDATIQTGTTWVGGGSLQQDGSDLSPQYALRFDASAGDTASAPHDSGIEPDADLSCFARVNLDSDAANQVVAREWGGTDGGPFLFQIDTGGTLRLSVGTGTDTTSTIGVSEGQTADIGVVLDDSTDEATFYVDDTTETVAFADSPVTTGTNQFVIGDFFGDRHLDGDIDDVAFAASEKSLSDWEAYRAGAETPADFDRFYAFDDGPGSTTATDSSGNGNDATLNGPEWVPPLSDPRHTLDALSNGEAYVYRWSTFTEHTEVF